MAIGLQDTTLHSLKKPATRPMGNVSQLKENGVKQQNSDVSTAALSNNHAVVFSSKKGKEDIAFTGGAEKKAAEGISKFIQKHPGVVDSILQNKAFQWTAKLANTSPAVCEGAVITLVVAGLFRPFATMLMPGPAKMEDRQFSATRAVVSSGIGAGIAVAAMQPIANAADKVIKSNPNLFKTPQEVDAFKFMTKYGPKFAFAIPTAWALFATIPPIMDRLFPHKKNDPNVNPNPVLAAKLNDSFQAVKPNNDVTAFMNSLTPEDMIKNQGEVSQKGLR